MWQRIEKRLRPMFDLTTWVLLSISLIPLWLIDPAMVLTLVQWSAYGLALAGVSIFLTRLFTPQIDLSLFVMRAAQGDVAAANVVRAVTLLLGMVFIGLVLWARA